MEEVTMAEKLFIRWGEVTRKIFHSQNNTGIIWNVRCMRKSASILVGRNNMVGGAGREGNTIQSAYMHPANSQQPEFCQECLHKWKSHSVPWTEISIYNHPSSTVMLQWVHMMKRSKEIVTVNDSSSHTIHLQLHKHLIHVSSVNTLLLHCMWSLKHYWGCTIVNDIFYINYRCPSAQAPCHEDIKGLRCM